MQVKATERVWDKVWPEAWPKTYDYGRESIVWHLYHNALRHPDKPAIIYYGQVFSYQEFYDLVRSVAGGLQKLGIKKGDRVYIQLQNSPQFIASFYGVMALGAVAICGSPMFKSSEIRYLINDSGARVAIMEDDLYPFLEGIRGELPAMESVIVTSLSEYLPEKPELPVPQGMDAPARHYTNTIDWSDFVNYELLENLVEIDVNKDIALLQYTSGTTGHPKGAMISHFNLLANTVHAPAAGHCTDADVNLAVLPLFHVSGMTISMTGHFYLGSTLVLLTRFEAKTVLMAIEKYKITAWHAFTPMNIAVMTHPDLVQHDISSLCHLTSGGGAPLPEAITQQYFEMTGSGLPEGYGMSETVGGITLNPWSRIKYGSVGIPVMNADIRIVDLEDESKNVKQGEEGELWLKGPTVALGYWNKPEATAEVFLDDGWLKSGDIGRMDEEGYIYLCGRRKEMIKVSGYSVFPAEVQEHLSHHPAIEESAVIGIPDKVKGEQIKAFIVLRPEWKDKIRAEEIIQWAREEMAVYKYPRQVEFRNELPKTAVGKILHKKLREEETRKSMI